MVLLLYNDKERSRNDDKKTTKESLAGIQGKGSGLLSIVVYGIIPDVSFAAMVMPPVPLP